jgi:hypothetical protein
MRLCVRLSPTREPEEEDPVGPPRRLSMVARGRKGRRARRRRSPSPDPTSRGALPHLEAVAPGLDSAAATSIPLTLEE